MGTTDGYLSLSSFSMGCVAGSVEIIAITVNQNEEDFSHIGIWEFLSTQVTCLFCNNLEF